MVSVLFSETVRAKVRIVLSNPGDRSTMQASSAYSIPHTTRRTHSVAGFGFIDVGGSLRCTTSTRTSVLSLNLLRAAVSTTAKMTLNCSGDNTHHCRSTCSTSNQSEQTPSSDRTQALVLGPRNKITVSVCMYEPPQ